MKQRGEQTGVESAAVLLSGDCRSLRGHLRPLVWVTLEEVALDALVEDGRLVARTSARQVAERLRVNPGAAAGALRVLRDRGLIALERGHGQAGRFGLSIYVVGDLPGLTVVPPPMAWPHVVSPFLEKPALREPDFAGPGVERPRAVRPHTAEPCIGHPHMDDLPASPSLPCAGREAFELPGASS